jgi:ATP-binding cassette subfamily C protein
VRPIVVTTPERDTGQVEPGRLTGKVALEHVTFRYQEHAPVILDNGCTPSQGSLLPWWGRLEVANLPSSVFYWALRLAGRIVSYDDQALSVWTSSVRRRLGTVLQQSTIMAGTIFENIAVVQRSPSRTPEAAHAPDWLQTSLACQWACTPL